MTFEMPALDGPRRVNDFITAFDGANIGMPMLGNHRMLSIKRTSDTTIDLIMKNMMVTPHTKEYFKINIEQVEAWIEDEPFLNSPAEDPTE